jgi:hypothetical protein
MGFAVGIGTAITNGYRRNDEKEEERTLFDQHKAASERL